MVRARKSKVGVIIHRPLIDELFTVEDKRRLSDVADVVWASSDRSLTLDEAAQLLRDCEIGVGSWGTPAPKADLLARCPDLKYWQHAAGSVKGMFGPHLEGRNFMIASCKSAIADCVAEMVLGEILIGLRRIPENAAANRAGTAGKPRRLKVLFGSTIGVIGASETGKGLMRLLRPLGCRVILHDPFVTPAQAREMGAELERDLLTFCASCDAISLHTPFLPSTTRLCGAREFQAMREDTLFINTSRGACIDEAALVAELEKGRLFAFLDVSDPEPALPDSPLRRLPNVVYTSHLAGPASRNIGRQVVEDIEAYLSGGAPRCVVTADQLDRIA